MPTPAPTILFPVLTPVAGSFCAAPGEPLRGVTVTHEGGREVAYLIGVTSHRGSRLAVLVPLDLPRSQIDAALRASLNAAFPGLGDRPGALAHLSGLLAFCAAQGQPGDVLDVTAGVVNLNVSLTPATPASLALVPELLAGAREQLLALCRAQVQHTNHPASYSIIKP